MTRLESTSKINALYREFPWLEAFIKEYSSDERPLPLVEIKVARADEELLTRVPRSGFEHFLPVPRKSQREINQMQWADQDRYRSFLNCVEFAEEYLYLVNEHGLVLSRVGRIVTTRIGGFLRKREVEDIEESENDTLDCALKRLGATSSRAFYAVSMEPVFKPDESGDKRGSRVTIYKPPQKLSFIEWMEKRNLEATSSLSDEIHKIDVATV